MASRSVLLLAAAFASLAGCNQGASPTANPPEIPAVAVDAFPPETRPQIEARLTALEAAPQSAKAAGDLALLLHANLQFDAAEKLYARAQALEPKAFRWPYYLGVVRTDLGDSAGALQAFERARKIDGSYLPLRRRLAATLADLNRISEAQSGYEALLADNANDSAAHFALGRLLAQDGQTDQALPHLEKAVRLVPDYGAAHYELSLAYRDAGRPDDAQRHITLYEQRKGAPRDQDPLMAAVDALKQGATDYIQRAVELEKKGDLDGAIAAHLDAIRADADVAQAHINLVSLYGRQGDVPKATEHYQKALELNPGQADLHYNYGVLLFGENRFSDARKAFEKAVEANPDYAAAHNNIGQILEREGRFDDAMRHYQAAVAAQPNYRLSRFHLGRMLMGKRRPQDAAEQFRRALEPRDEMTPQVLFGLAAAMAQSGDRTAALQHGEEAKALAEQLGQNELARRIEADLEKLR